MGNSKEIEVISLGKKEEEIRKIAEKNQRVLEETRKENKIRKIQLKFMFVLTAVLVFAVAFATGMVLGRYMAFIIALGY